MNLNTRLIIQTAAGTFALGIWLVLGYWAAQKRHWARAISYAVLGGISGLAVLVFAAPFFRGEIRLPGWTGILIVPLLALPPMLELNTWMSFRRILRRAKHE